MGLVWLEAYSLEASNTESTGVESDSSMGAATKAVVFQRRKLAHRHNVIFGI